MGLKQQLRNDLKEALRAKDERRKSVIRMILAEITNAEIAGEGDLGETDIVALLQKDARRRQETIVEIRQAGRTDLLEKEETELRILETYLPRMLTREEIAAEARQVIEQIGARGMKDLGSVMRELMPKMKGRADGRLVNQVVRELLAN